MMPQPTITPNSAKHFLDRLIQVDVNTHDAPSLVFNDLVKVFVQMGLNPALL